MPRELFLLYLLLKFFASFFNYQLANLEWTFVEYSVMFFICPFLLPKIFNSFMVRMFKIFWNIQVAVIFIVWLRLLRPILTKRASPKNPFCHWKPVFLLLLWTWWCEILSVRSCTAYLSVCILLHLVNCLLKMRFLPVLFITLIFEFLNTLSFFLCGELNPRSWTC